MTIGFDVMSDTPRTDGAEWEVEMCHDDAHHAFGLTDSEYMAMAVPSSFARMLEREINALKHDLERAMNNHRKDLEAK